MGTSTLTLGHDVTMRGQISFVDKTQLGGTTVLNVINQGTMVATVVGTDAARQYFLETLTTSFINQGSISADQWRSLLLFSKAFTNAATGDIKITASVASNFIQGQFGNNLTSTFANAGTIELTSTLVWLMNSSTGSWSNTGSNQYRLQLKSDRFRQLYQRRPRSRAERGPSYPSGDHGQYRANVHIYRRFGIVILADNGTVKGGTLVMTGPNQKLRFEPARWSRHAGRCYDSR